MVKSKNHTGSNSFTFTKTTLSKSLFQPKIFDSCILLNFANYKKTVFQQGLQRVQILGRPLLTALSKGNEVRLRQKHNQIV